MDNPIPIKRLHSLAAPMSCPASDIAALLAAELAQLGRKIIVLDDDPTGIQSIHNLFVYTDWSQKSIAEIFAEQQTMAFILTNSRAMTVEQTKKVHQKIAKRIMQEANKPFLLISRGDSTLRGHYPLETLELKNTCEKLGHPPFDAEVIIPFFAEGGRYTIDNIHYIQQQDVLVPVGQTEYAKDKTFGYQNSDLRQWCEEKTKGSYTADSCLTISLDLLRRCAIEPIVELLLSASGFQKIIVNAITYDDLRVFTIALCQALNKGKEFLFHTAASFLKVISNNPDRPLLTQQELLRADEKRGGLIIVGSHVKRTTEQINYLVGSSLNIVPLEFNQHLVLSDQGLEPEVQKITAAAQKAIEKGSTALIFTRRERLDLDTESAEKQLLLSTRISDSLTSIVSSLTVRPAFIIAKGGITSSDVGTKALHVHKALVLGQVAAGVPVWRTGDESRYPHLPYILFPGNVGEKETLASVVQMLMQ